MARRLRIGGLIVSAVPVEEDARPTGSLLFADPSAAEFPRRIHTFNEPHSDSSYGTNGGIRTLTPWSDPWADHRRKRGVHEEDES